MWHVVPLLDSSVSGVTIKDHSDLQADFCVMYGTSSVTTSGRTLLHVDYYRAALPTLG